MKKSARKSARFRTGLLVACLASLSGCGGGGSSPIQPAPTFRANHAGDSWTYSVHIDFGIFGAYDGTLDEGLSSDTYNGSPSIRFTRSFVIQLPQGPAQLSSYSESAPDGALLAETVGPTLVAVVDNTFFVPTTLAVGASSFGSITLANGDVHSYSYRVVGAQIVQTALGQFSCWVVDEEVVHSDGTTDRFKFWIPPETGNYVQLTDTTVNPDGTGYTYRASVTATSSAAAGGQAAQSARSGPVMPMRQLPALRIK